jgi:hypothetical protein
MEKIATWHELNIYAFMVLVGASCISKWHVHITVSVLTASAFWPTVTNGTSSRPTSNSTVLVHPRPYLSVLYYTVLYSTIPSFIVDVALQQTVPFHTQLSFTVLVRIKQQYSLFRTLLTFTVLVRKQQQSFRTLLLFYRSATTRLCRTLLPFTALGYILQHAWAELGDPSVVSRDGVVRLYCCFPDCSILQWQRLPRLFYLIMCSDPLSDLLYSVRTVLTFRTEQQLLLRYITAFIIHPMDSGVMASTGYRPKFPKFRKVRILESSSYIPAEKCWRLLFRYNYADM